jgi:hypothetical protein
MKTLNGVKVSNIIGHAGNKVKNQFVITTEAGRYFQSYDSVIALIPVANGPIQLDEYFYNYSTTTAKYRNRFLNDDTKGIEAGIKSGRYILTNLN